MFDHPKHRALAIDGGLALASFLLAVGLMASGGFGAEEPGARGLDVAGVLLALGGSAPLLGRRRAIVPAFLAIFASYVAIAALRYPIDIMLGPLIALYTLAGAAARSVPRPLAIGLAFASYLAVGVGIAIGYDVARVADAEAVLFLFVWVAIWVAGDRSQLRLDKVAWLEERAQRAEGEAQRERQLVAAEERTQIARDLHDSAAHSINVILVQAGAARLLQESDPAGSAEAIRTIEVVAREQIGEIDRLVHALRLQGSEQGEEDGESCRLPGDVPRGPAAGKALFERMRAIGLDLRVERRGRPRRLGQTVGRSFYRILQESLTNALRHGDGSATVVMDFGEEALELTIENPSSNGGGPIGHGLVGMRERVSLIGGDFSVGSRHGTFRVRARIPYEPGLEAMPARNSGAGK